MTCLLRDRTIIVDVHKRQPKRSMCGIPSRSRMTTMRLMDMPDYRRRPYQQDIGLALACHVLTDRLVVTGKPHRRRRGPTGRAWT